MKQYLPLLVGAIAVGCSNEPVNDTVNDEPEPALTYYADTKAIIDAKCASCHTPGEIGPFPLTTHEEVLAFGGAVRASIENGTMPPWQPSDECNTYAEDIDLTTDEKSTLLAWFDAGSPAGDPADDPGGVDQLLEPGFEADLVLPLPEPYTPVLEPDDYRCQIIDWPADETRFVTGLRVIPDQGSIVHHVIAFIVGPDEAERFRAFDDAEEGPGYTCYGGPTANGASDEIDLPALLAALEEMGLTVADLQAGNVTDEQLAELMSRLGRSGFASLGSWVPGAPDKPYPAGTGIRVEPGSVIVAQVHYNTLVADPVADQSVIEIATTDTVEREATNLAAIDVGWVTDGRVGEPMTIPAGEEHVEHETLIDFDSFFMARARQTLQLPEDAPLVVHTANHHMHELGKSQRSEVRHSDGSTSCLLDIPDWDFSWQGSYTLTESVTIRPGDQLWMGCAWDNSAANQPIIDGQVKEPTDVAWGEGTTDEMCLGAYYVTGE